MSSWDLTAKVKGKGNKSRKILGTELGTPPLYQNGRTKLPSRPLDPVTSAAIGTAIPKAAAGQRTRKEMWWAVSSKDVIFHQREGGGGWCSAVRDRSSQCRNKLRSPPARTAPMADRRQPVGPDAASVAAPEAELSGLQCSDRHRGAPERDSDDQTGSGDRAPHYRFLPTRVARAKLQSLPVCCLGYSQPRRAADGTMRLLC